MCGITGVINARGRIDSTEICRKMSEAIAHRGPDGDGYWCNINSTVALAHRRLSIIDLSSSADQPMFVAGRYTIVFNGEIYNYLELKKILIEYGYSFLTESDTEVLVAMYQHYGVQCLDYLDGMFAFVLYDQLEDLIFISRDRFGEKPFYYSIDNDIFYFSSEIKSFWKIGLPKIVDDEMLGYFLHYAQVHHPHNNSKTFFKNIIKLKPAHYLFGTPQNLFKASQIQYWRLPENRDTSYDSLSEKEIFNKFYILFETSVKRRLRSDVPVGSSLSGGLDSSSVVCMIHQLKRESNISQSTFSARFPGFVKDEGNFMKFVIDATNTSAFFAFPDKEGFLSNFSTMVFHQDEPFGSGSIYAQFEVMRLAKEKSVTVLLDGQGADEMLGGYSYYRDTLNAQNFVHSLGPQVSPNTPPMSARQMLKAFIKSKAPGILDVYRGLKIKSASGIIYSPYSKEFSYFLKKLKSPYPNHTSLYEHLRHDLTSGNLEDLLRYADRNSMAHSREVRLPFLNHQLVEFVLALNDSYKINGEWTKWVQRKSMSRIMPNEITWRKDKIGYEPPQQSWMDDIDFKERVMDSKNILFKNGIINKREKEMTPTSAGSNQRGDNSWAYLMSGVLFE
ncbi:MAG: asparagine synthase (glutamine-hydrolyzing) [Bacteroidetes bacterium]|nr:asparagine synthase (glutamine-hydrolyzing) [Bacteroidota bacterium]